MSILSRAAPPQREPIIVTIAGSAGSGKTSLASTFPKPILIRTVGEALPRDIVSPPDVMPELSKADDLWDILKALLNEEHDYRTAIFDSVTGLDSLFVQEVLDQEKASNNGKARGIVQALGGWGAGPAAVQAQHLRVRKAVEYLRKRRGMNIVFVAHAEIADVSPPDADPYSLWSVRLPKKSIAPYTDSVDLVGFIKQTTIVRGAVEAKKDAPARPGRATTTGDRVLVSYLQPSSISKNRFGIDYDIDVVKGENPLAFLIEDAPKDKVKPARQRRQPDPEPETERDAGTDNDEYDEAAEAALDAMTEGE